MTNAILVDDVRVDGRALRIYHLSAPASFRGLGMKTSRVMVSVAEVSGSNTEVAVLPVARDGDAISYRQAVIRTEQGTDAIAGVLDSAALNLAGIHLGAELTQPPQC